jgi:DNA repair exonuclease SbcCD nuclease subunit
MLKLRYLSDLHTEFIKPNKIKHLLNKIQKTTEDEICVLAGDIGNPYKSNYDEFMSYINKTFIKTFVISGNHEYYGNLKTTDETDTYLMNYFKKYENISYLNNSYEEYRGYRFIGTTLWSKIDDVNYEINDTSKIYDLSILKYNKLHTDSVDFLNNTLKNNNSTKNNIIISHHLPSYDLIHEKYKTIDMEPYNQWFASNLNNLIENNQNNICYWIYGHTHTPSVKYINNIPFICNPIGYPNENENSVFDRFITL